MIDTLAEYRNVLQQALDVTEPMSLRARILATAMNLVERSKRILESVDAGEKPLNQIAIMLETRDIARDGQRWVDELLRDEVPDDQILERLHFWKAHLAIVEVSSGMAIAYVGSDREDSREASWWARRGGEAVMQAAALAAEMMELPASREPNRAR